MAMTKTTPTLTPTGTRPSSAAFILAGAEEEENDAPAWLVLLRHLRQPRVVCAILCATIAYSMMVFSWCCSRS